MPELPEVETICQGLAPLLVGQKIQQLELFRAGLRYPFPADFVEQMEGQRVERLYRRSKYLLASLTNGSWITHLGMSGRLLYHPAATSAPPLQKHDHLRLLLSNGASLIYNDARRFGAMDVTSSPPEEHPWLRHLGAEPLETSAKDIWPLIHASQSPIKLRIMDSRVLVGVGNIYASESLFRAAIHPETASRSLKEAEWQRLFAAIQAVLAEAIASGGSTLRDFVRSSGDAGYFQHRFAVYGRTGEPCHQCQTPVLRLVQSGRSSFLCPCCQPARYSD